MTLLDLFHVLLAIVGFVCAFVFARYYTRDSNEQYWKGEAKDWSRLAKNGEKIIDNQRLVIDKLRASNIRWRSIAVEHAPVAVSATATLQDLRELNVEDQPPRIAKELN